MLLSKAHLLALVDALFFYINPLDPPLMGEG